MLKMKFIFCDSYFLKSALTTLMIKTMLMYSHNALLFFEGKVYLQEIKHSRFPMQNIGENILMNINTCIYGIVAHVYSAATVNALVSPTLDLAEFVSSL